MSNPKKQRGRRTGSVLKGIDKSASALKIAETIAFGHSADNPIAQMVRSWREMRQTRPQLALLKSSIESKLIEWAEKIDRTSLDVQSTATTAQRQAIDYVNRNRLFEHIRKRRLNQLILRASVAMENDDADWFRKVAAAIDSEVKADEKDTNPFHASLLLLAQLSCTVNKDGVRCYRTDARLDPALPHTIRELMEKLKNHRPVGQSDVDFARTIRANCAQLGLSIKASKQGRPKKEPLRAHKK